ncbi:MAG: hypothetical protein ABJA78_07500 [Ferruginibacter sp.]
MSAVKPGTNEVTSIGLGLVSWILPDIPVVIKIIISLIVVSIIIFLLMEKDQRQKVAAASGNTFRDYIIPGLAGALKYFFIALVAIYFLSMGSTMILNKPGLFTHPLPLQADYRTGETRGWLGALWDVLSNLNAFSYVIAIGMSIYGMVKTINEAKPKVKVDKVEEINKVNKVD